ncbi:N-terminal acetyltransferase [Tulasnella sp. JGI-2019a]|nr:N-terminal acetyltransferase [Tulasnella sp. JGI-2019a]KAG9013190.1 N-terminal acetyltransferase [Tulasnella sp. JGI-2019a]
MVKIKAVPSFYSDEQLSAYLKCIGLESLSRDRETTLGTMTQIMQHHLCTFAWENTRMHYTESGSMDVDPPSLYSRFVHERQGGSFCFGQNTMLMGMLRAMGFRVYATAGRVNQNQSITELNFVEPTHMVLFVQIPPKDPPSIPLETYVVDVGFGIGPARPILLKEYEIVQGAAPPEKHRLIKAPIPNSSLDEDDDESKQIAENWRVQVNLDEQGKPLPEGTWRSIYAFGMKEFFLRDFEALAFLVAHRPGGLFWEGVNVTRWEAFGNEGALARVVMSKKGKVMWYGDEKRTLMEFRSEADRMRALRENFGIHVDEGSEKYLRPGVQLDFSQES